MKKKKSFTDFSPEFQRYLSETFSEDQLVEYLKDKISLTGVLNEKVFDTAFPSPSPGSHPVKSSKISGRDFLAQTFNRFKLYIKQNRVSK